MNYGKALYTLRRCFAMSAAETARCVHISRSYMAEIEHGKKNPSHTIIESYAAVFGLKVSEITRLAEVLQEDNNAVADVVLAFVRSL